MKKCVLVAAALGIIGLVGCAKVAPAALKAVAGEGAKVAPKLAPKAAGAGTPVAAQPARTGEVWKEIRNEGAMNGAEYGVNQLTERNKKRR